MNTIVTNAGPGRASRDFAPKSRFGPVAIGVMVAFHGLVGYALVNGLGKQVIFAWIQWALRAYFRS